MIGAERTFALRTFPHTFLSLVILMPKMENIYGSSLPLKWMVGHEILDVIITVSFMTEVEPQPQEGEKKVD